MTRTAIALLVAAVLSACGGEPIAPGGTSCGDEICPSAAADFAGSWEGLLASPDPHVDTFSYYVSLKISVQDNAVVVEGICPDRTGRLVAVGFGGKAAWDATPGSITCYAPEVCRGGTLRYTKAAMDADGDLLVLRMWGVCGFDAFRVEMYGIRTMRAPY